MLPKSFLEQMQVLLGEEAQPFFESLKRSPTAGLRVNTLKISPADFQALSPFPLTPVAWCPAGFQVGPGSQPGKHPYHACGLYYLQEPSAMAVGEVVQAGPGECILDLASAPGGKATHLAVALGGQGLLVANEIHPQRVWELVENLERWGPTNAVITQESPSSLADHFGAYFDRVLLDAPCSGEGMFRKSEVARQEWSPGLVQSCAVRQISILDEAARLVRPGGRLVYSTCTFNPLENEAVIDHFLATYPEFELEAPLELPGASAGRPDWVEGEPPALEKTVRFWPHLSEAEGHFIASLTRQAKTSANPSLSPGRGPNPGRRTGQNKNRALPLSKPQRRLVEVFLNEILKPGSRAANWLDSASLVLQGYEIYAQPANLPRLEGLHLVRPGAWLGSLRKERFIPSHSLALLLTSNDVQQSVHFTPGAPELVAYLHGEEIPLPGEKGWVLVCVGAFALGWVRRSEARGDMVLKNYYPRGLRR